MTPSAPRYHRVRMTARITALAAVAMVALLTGVTLPALAHSGAPATPEQVSTWFARLTPDGDDTNVRFDAGGLRLDSVAAGPASIRSHQPEGMLLTAVHPLTQFSSQVATEIVAEQPAGSAVAVDVRGTRGDGSWTEWITTTGRDTPTALGAAVTGVQARVVLRGANGASPVVRSVRLSAIPGVQLLAARPRDARSHRVFATREGLVGGKTANGHVIRERDHFVALPSRRGLSPRGKGDYTVKVCADNGRCEWAPVWDVGPWNTTDDYWNPSDARQSWSDLPQGLPQAQAAYQDKYHEGKDQFGRKVRNPAGIDLADGTFWDGLRLRNNSWVTVNYLWVDGGGSPAIVRLPVLPVRSGPGEQHPEVGLAAKRARLVIECAVTGQLVTGSKGGTDQWLRIGPNQFIPAAHVSIPAVPGGTGTTKVPGVQQVSAQRCATP